MKTYVVSKTFVMCRTLLYHHSLWEQVGRCDDTNKNELLQHGKTDVDLSFFPPILFLHLVVFFPATCIAKVFAPGKMLFCIGKLRLSVIHRNDIGDIGMTFSKLDIPQSPIDWHTLAANLSLQNTKQNREHPQRYLYNEHATKGLRKSTVGRYKGPG